MTNLRAFNLAILLLLVVVVVFICTSSVNAQSSPPNWEDFQIKTHLVLSGKIVRAELLPEPKDTYITLTEPRIKMTVSVTDMIFVEPEVASFKTKPETIEINMPDWHGVAPVGIDATFFASRSEGKWVTLHQVGVWPFKSVQTSLDQGKSYSNTVVYDLDKRYIGNFPKVFKTELFESKYKQNNGVGVIELERVLHSTPDKLKKHLEDQLLNKIHPMIYKKRRELLANYLSSDGN